MPELPDITVYIEALESRILGQTLERVRITSPFLLRTVDPPVSALEGRTVRQIRRIGKRIAINVGGGDEEALWAVLHLMIAGRLHWQRRAGKTLAEFFFPNGTLTLTEAGSKRRASLHIVHGEAALTDLDPGGIDVLTATPDAFRAALAAENHTLKRSLSDPRILGQTLERVRITSPFLLRTVDPPVTAL